MSRMLQALKQLDDGNTSVAAADVSCAVESPLLKMPSARPSSGTTFEMA